MKRLRVGLLGLGVVGGATAALIEAHAPRWRQRFGIDVSWVRALVRDPGKPRTVEAPERLTLDPAEVVEADDVDVVVEAMGGVEPACSYVLRALQAGKSVVTANKALLAERWEDLQAAAAAAGVQLGYEAAVAAAVPCLSAFDHVLAAARVVRIEACLNGTCGYILTRMERTGAPVEEVVREAQMLGYAEADPGDDLSGLDAMRKGTVLSLLAFGERPSRVVYRGLEDVSPADVLAALADGERLRLVARLERGGDGRPELRVAPERLPAEHPLARLAGPENGLVIEADPLGRLFLSGPGAGGPATASAVAGDLLAVAAGRRRPTAPAAAAAGLR